MSQNKAADEALKIYCEGAKFFSSQKVVLDKAWNSYQAIATHIDEKTGDKVVFNIWHKDLEIDSFYSFLRRYIDSHVDATLKVLNENP